MAETHRNLRLRFPSPPKLCAILGINEGRDQFKLHALGMLKSASFTSGPIHLAAEGSTLGGASLAALINLNIVEVFSHGYERS